MSKSNNLFDQKKALQQSFETSYNKLNNEQRQVVDNIEGVCVVNAGPGTGKTEVLSLRIANILDKIDTSPGNILCLTYTEAGASNMKERLARFLGSKSTKVNISTFHSFASEVINSNPEHFFNSAKFNPIETLTQYQVYLNIFKTLPLSYKISSYHPKDGYVYLKSVQELIGDLKKEGISDEIYAKILETNEIFLKKIEVKAIELLEIASKIRSNSKDWLEKITEISIQLNELFAESSFTLDEYTEKFGENTSKYIFNNCNIANCFSKKLQIAIKNCIETNKSTPFTDFRNALTKKTKMGLKLIEFDRLAINREVLFVYIQYNQAMYNNAFYDFDDMILDLLRELGNNEELLMNLQEKYQHILVDEFQDTNGSQLQIIDYLIKDNENPNLLVVGDTDQTIFKFQGAVNGNLENFTNRFKNAIKINMFTNYRSNQKILDFAQYLILQSIQRDHDSKTSLTSGI